LSPIKTAQARITKSSLWDATKTLVFCDKKFRAFGRDGHETGTHLERRYFAVIGSSSVKTVADKYRHTAYHNTHWWRDF